MGYMTEFHFQCDCSDEKRMEQIVQKMRELQIVPYVFEASFYSYDPCWCELDNCGPRTWYTEEKDMRALSREFPDVHFIIQCVRGDQRRHLGGALPGRQAPALRGGDSDSGI